MKIDGLFSRTNEFYRVVLGRRLDVEEIPLFINTK